jgi:hypothetical protein
MFYAVSKRIVLSQSDASQYDSILGEPREVGLSFLVSVKKILTVTQINS